MKTKRKKNQADAKHAKEHGRDLVETERDYLQLSKEHRKWYKRGAMGKQRGKPHYAPPKIKKSPKSK